MTRHCQTKWCQRQHSTWCLLRAHPSAESKSVSTGNSELCWFYSDWLHFRNCAGGKKKNHFLSEKESLRKMVHHDLKMHTEVNHVNSEAMAPSKKKKSGLYNSRWGEICLEPLCHSPKETQGANSQYKHSSLRLEEPALPQGQIFNQSLTLPFTGQKMLQVWICVSLLN